MKDGKTTFTVLTKKEGGREIFQDFYSSWKIKKTPESKPSITQKGENTQSAQSNDTDVYSGAKLQKVSDSSKEETDKIFDAAKKKFGITHDLREADYVLPDGSMLDFSGRHTLDKGADSSSLNGRRTTDHREISGIAYEYDADGNELETGIETDMSDFIRRGAIRIDSYGTINLSVKPTPEQRRVIERLVRRTGGDVSVDFGDGWDSVHYAEYEGASVRRVLGDIDKYFDEGLKPDGNIKFFRTENGDAYGFTLNGKIYIDPRIATAETPVHEYHHLWAEALEKSNPDAWTHLKSELYKDADLVSWVKERYPDLVGDENALAHEFDDVLGVATNAQHTERSGRSYEERRRDTVGLTIGLQLERIW